MDKITITITRGCDAAGIGGEIVDNASAILGDMPDGTPIVDVLVAAFADTYGVHAIEGEPVSGYRNLSYRCRQFMTEVVASYAAKTAASAAQTQSQAVVAQAMGSVTILDA